MKALILAAGFGTRLRPLTLKAPKPMIPFYGFPFLDHAKNILSKHIESSNTFINTHYLHEIVEDHINKSPLYKGVQLSYEKEILGTGGSINPIRTMVGDDDLLIYNSDIISDIDIQKLIKEHKDSNNIATMVLLKNSDKTKTQLYTVNNHIEQIGGEEIPCDNSYSFTGVHIVSKTFIDNIPKSGFQNIIDTYKSLLETKKIGFTLHEGIWFDLGTPQSLLDTHLKIASNKSYYDSLNIDRLFKLYSKTPLEHDYSHVYAYPISINSLNTINENCIICDYSNTNSIDSIKFENVLWIDGNFEDSKLDNCIVWDEIKVKL